MARCYLGLHAGKKALEHVEKGRALSTRVTNAFVHCLGKDVEEEVAKLRLPFTINWPTSGSEMPDEGDEETRLRGWFTEVAWNLAGTPTRVLALHVQDVVLPLKGELMGIAVGAPASVREPLHPTLFVAIEDLVASLAGDSELLHDDDTVGTPEATRRTARSTKALEPPAEPGKPPDKERAMRPPLGGRKTRLESERGVDR